jgi:hypothetical protein
MGIYRHESGGAFHDEALTGAFSNNMGERERDATIGGDRRIHD